MFRAFGKFMDDAVRMTMTEVETKYGRVPDKRDGTFDPESGTEVPIEHYCLYENGTPGRKLVDSIRLHGYTRTNGGYFVVTRLDWFHDYHSK